MGRGRPKLKEEEKRIRVTYTIPPDLKKELDIYAKEERISVSQLITMYAESLSKKNRI